MHRTPRIVRIAPALGFLAFFLPSAAAAAAISAEAIETAAYSGGALPSGQNPLTAKAQILLDRSGISPGVIDGIRGGMSTSAIAAFEGREGLASDGTMDQQVWEALQKYAAKPLMQDYTITAADAGNLTKSIPSDYLEKANMTTLGYTSVAEKLAERFHMHESLLSALNPGVDLVEGVTIKVAAPSKPHKAQISRILIDKGSNRVSAYDGEGHMVVNYPATIGSVETPSPSGTHNVRAVAIDPEYTYNPSKNFKQGDNNEALTIPPGPNGPVGSVWIALTKPTYGIHGTPTPSRLFVSESHGCVRLTNWDAQELAHMVKPGGTSVEFIEKGGAIASASPEKPVDGANPKATSAASTATGAPAGDDFSLPAAGQASPDGTSAAANEDGVTPAPETTPGAAAMDAALEQALDQAPDTPATARN